MIMFGGIHDIAHEKNDLFSFDFAKNQWKKIDPDFTESIKLPEKLLAKIPESKLAQNHKQKVLVTPKVTYVPNPLPIKKHFTPKSRPSPRSKSPRNKSKHSILMMHGVAPEKSAKEIREERLKHQMLEKKTQLLAEFEILDEEKKMKQLDLSPTTETMKKSIVAFLCNVTPQNDQDKKEIFNTSVISKDRKPCARDGCSGNLMDKKLVLFGGDRHNMTFKDLFILDLEKLWNE